MCLVGQYSNISLIKLLLRLLSLFLQKHWNSAKYTVQYSFIVEYVWTCDQAAKNVIKLQKNMLVLLQIYAIVKYKVLYSEQVIV
jgi:hypothetical protein